MSNHDQIKLFLDEVQKQLFVEVETLKQGYDKKRIRNRRKLERNYTWAKKEVIEEMLEILND